MLNRCDSDVKPLAGQCENSTALGCAVASSFARPRRLAAISLNSQSRNHAQGIAANAGRSRQGEGQAGSSGNVQDEEDHHRGPQARLPGLTTHATSAVTCEGVTGILVRELAPRDEIVLANAILISMNNSLRRLSTDHVDLIRFIAGTGYARREDPTRRRLATLAISALLRCPHGTLPSQPKRLYSAESLSGNCMSVMMFSPFVSS
ncbi:hypothetical protein BQ8794_50378 [Mesorhizobium prunaredense]|uniref:Uncharacterized protein n=1 Tax=Mesorhizobium prunaredense TaxID=1631249 RepID=A0A1R3VEE8_9HYPH|nr:hypothetical protein BQ8794_50378 [Mesorhizobium prunaredense]